MDNGQAGKLIHLVEALIIRNSTGHTAMVYQVQLTIKA